MLKIDIIDRKAIKHIISGGFYLMLSVIILYGMFIRPKAANIKLLKNISKREQDLKEMQELKSEFLRLLEGKKFFRGRAGTQTDKFELSSSMESKISSLGLEQYREYMKPYDEQLDNKYKLCSINISFRKIPLEKLIEYIYECETNQYPLWIDKLSLAPVEDSNNLMDVDLNITTFKIQN